MLSQIQIVSPDAIFRCSSLIEAYSRFQNLEDGEISLKQKAVNVYLHILERSNAELEHIFQQISSASLNAEQVFNSEFRPLILKNQLNFEQTESFGRTQSLLSNITAIQTQTLEDDQSYYYFHSPTNQSEISTLFSNPIQQRFTITIPQQSQLQKFLNILQTEYSMAGSNAEICVLIQNLNNKQRTLLYQQISEKMNTTVQQIRYLVQKQLRRDLYEPITEQIRNQIKQFAIQNGNLSVKDILEEIRKRFNVFPPDAAKIVHRIQMKGF
ncbi:Hypothetical_protein [Hexamita inflata]|uniref:Hypothetical_protein n=1 Tax=Hexamita inflata TaxID=28002 RepID=A0AA86PL14_9EUKA|nr:Hypothetical protein HINF_LOCUS28896 [Hexamita inflata]